MANKKPGVEIDPSDYASLKQALSKIERTAPSELTKGAAKASRNLAGQARAKLAASSVWGRLVAPSVRPTSGTTPGMTAGGSGSFRAPRSANDDISYGALLFGAEYGVKSGQWPGHRWKGASGGAGYGIWRAVEEGGRRLYSDWTDDLVTTVERIWSHKS